MTAMLLTRPNCMHAAIDSSIWVRHGRLIIIYQGRSSLNGALLALCHARCDGSREVIGAAELC